jgi:hypothetical protein
LATCESSDRNTAVGQVKISLCVMEEKSAVTSTDISSMRIKKENKTDNSYYSQLVADI